MAFDALEWLDEEYVICRLDASDAIPRWARGRFTSVTRTLEELSIICEAATVPPETRQEGPWSAMRVAGKLDFGQVGVLAKLSQSLAAAGVTLLAVSTFDTDYLLVPLADRSTASAALRAAGHAIAD